MKGRSGSTLLREITTPVCTSLSVICPLGNGYDGDVRFADSQGDNKFNGHRLRAAGYVGFSLGMNGYITVTWRLEDYLVQWLQLGLQSPLG